MNDFIYNHLYYFVPEFIDYPYDEFSSSFDIVLFIIKILLSISGTTNIVSLGKFSFYIIFFLQVFFSFYFINKLINHSYLFMKNSFLNRTRLGLFFTKTIIIFIAILFGKSEILTIRFLIICISVLLVNMAFMYFLYNPYLHIKIKRESPIINLVFYLFILSEKYDIEFLFEKKLKEHYEQCGICEMCNKFNKYLKIKYNKNLENEEKEKFINEENKNNNVYYKDKLMDLFTIIYNGRNKYFKLIKKIIINYKNKGKEALANKYYYINITFLIYYDYHRKNITLSLNERILLEVLNKENQIFLHNHESQINQLLLCNNFINLSDKILSQLKDIINSEHNFHKAKKLIDLSFLLKKMKNKKYKKNLFDNKLERTANLKHLILICSIIYEEIFNTTLNNSQYPIRDNFQIFEDIFYSNKIQNIISLAVDLVNKNCKIIRAGKELYTYINNDLFDLFPLVFKQFQINMFMTNIIQKFDVEENIENFNKNNSKIKNDKKVRSLGTKNVRKSLKDKYDNQNKKEGVELNLIISENYSSKMYYKLLTLKLSPLFNKENHHYILFDGLYLLHKNTFITLQNLEEKLNSKEKIIGVSEPYLNKFNEENFISFKTYISWQYIKGYICSKLFSFNISFQLYNVYELNKKEKEIKKKKDNIPSKVSIMEDEEEDPYANKETKVEKIQLEEDNASVSSAQKGSNYNNDISNLGIKNKIKNNIYEYGGFNKIRSINYLILTIALCTYILGYFYLDYLKRTTSNNNIALLQFREFTKLYFELFTSILGVSCIFSRVYNIGRPDDCVRISEKFADIYFFINKANFNYTLYSLIQNEILASEIMEKKYNIINIHKNIGNKKYNELFGKKMTYFRVTQSIFEKQSYYNATKINIQFYEALLTICNTFKALTNLPNIPMIFLNKAEDPFSASNGNKRRGVIIMTDNHKLFYEMIINYKNYNQELELITDKLIKIITSKSLYIEIFIYICITFDISLLVFIGTLMLLYTTSFENLLIKIINYINLIMNEKNDNFSFSEAYLKKIENLEEILQFYKASPAKTINNLNNLYNNYQKYLTKNKWNINDMIKKKYKKINIDNKKKELENIPKNQRIISIKDVKSLGITYKFKIIYFFALFLILVLYATLLYIWINYFSKKKNLYNLMIKNMSLELSTYRAINAYELMIFQNFTIDEIGEIVFPFKKYERNLVFKTFYNDLKFAFNIGKEKRYIDDIYSDLGDKSNFTCEKLFNTELIQKIENNTKAKPLKNILNNLISICEFSKITITNDYRNVFERHFQYVRNGMLSIDDFSYKGRLLHIINNQSLPSLSIFFNIIIINTFTAIYTIPHKNAINNLIKLMDKLLAFSQIVLLFFFIIVNIFAFFLFIPGINNLCNQILILQKIFKICEMEQ